MGGLGTLAVLLPRLGHFLLLFLALGFLGLALGFLFFAVFLRLGFRSLVGLLLGLQGLGLGSGLRFLGVNDGAGCGAVLGRVDDALGGCGGGPRLLQNLVRRDVRWRRSVAEHFAATFIHPLPLGESGLGAREQR